MTNAAIEKLQRILKLESQKFEDKAVTRGLGSFALAFVADAQRNGLATDWSETVAESMRSYSAMTDIDGRKRAMIALMDLLTTAIQGEKPPPHEPMVAEPVKVNNQRSTAGNRRGADNGHTAGNNQRATSNNQTAAAAAGQATVHAGDSRRTVTPASQVQSRLGLNASIEHVNGIGPANALLFGKLNITTIRDLLFHFPTRYDDYSALKTINRLEYGETVTILARVAAAFRQKTKTNLVIVRAHLEDASGVISCSWFRDERSADSLMKQLVVGREVVVSGKVGEYMGKLTFSNPTFELAEREWITGGRIVPVYRLTEGLQPMLVRRVMKRVSEYWSAQVNDYLPDVTRRSGGLVMLPDALREIHFPRDVRSCEIARKRLAFDELFTVQMSVLRQRILWRNEPAPAMKFDELMLGALASTLPYTLTGAQTRAIQRISKDMQSSICMRRLLQGDVGSGKTVVGALGMALAASNGFQSALMAPTEILAEQHFKNLEKLFASMTGADVSTSAPGAQASGLSVPPPLTTMKVRLLTGSTKAADKRAIKDELASGAVQVVIGTHALIQEDVSFSKLGFVVVDEQHRFGVEQRKALRAKGAPGADGRAINPHTLFMTATPIPRTLALTLYGDLDNTVLDELPPGRQPIATHWFVPTERERAYAFVRGQISQGRQAFVICPLVVESDKIEAKAAVEEHARLQKEVFPNLKLGLLHGRMKPREKEQVMSAFARNEINVLVSTSVVEVGIDVPNATVMLIEGANRFGLSQLHQFRGRVGRGAYASTCLLLADSAGAVSDQRLQAIVSTQDGFKLAEKDLEIRGPGEFFGTRQSGEPELKLVGIGDRDLLDVARNQAEAIYAADPNLDKPENVALNRRITEFWAARTAEGESAGDAS